MNILARLLSAIVLFGAVPAAAQTYIVTVEEWEEEVETSGGSGYVSPDQAEAERSAIDSSGPFRVMDARTIAIVGTTNARSPAQFAALLLAYPEVDFLDFVESPGTMDDLANFELGRMIRAAGLTTRVKAGGSVRSGGVELFVAGARMEIAPGAEFAVHGWMDERGRGAEDYRTGSPEHQRYLDYYHEMGMADALAAAFYAMTNSVPFEDARWLTGTEMAGWLGMTSAQALPAVLPAGLPLPLPPQPVALTLARTQLAYLDLDLLVP